MSTNDTELWNKYEYARAYDETCITILFFAGNINPDTTFIKLKPWKGGWKNHKHILR